MSLSARPVYLDCQSTTPLDPRVADVLVESVGMFGNPHARQHVYGNAAAEVVEDARAKVASLIGAYPRRIVFTSGATESCNLALRGAARAAPPGRRRIVTVATEHPAVLETVGDLEGAGVDAVRLPVTPDGLVDLNRLEDAIDDSTLIVSVMAVNNEIGVIQPLAEIGAMCHRHGALFHTDATQAPGRIDVDVDAWGVDLLTISAHKVYGPMGIGALFVADDRRLGAVVTGGGQERGFRSGTVPTPLAAGFGEAADIAAEEWPADAERMTALTTRLRDGLASALPHIRFFGSLESRAPGSLSVGVPALPGEQVVSMVASDIAISTGSACASHDAAVSHVLTAIGCSRAEASTAVRIGIGRFTTEQDIDRAIAALARAAAFPMRDGSGKHERHEQEA